jgi:hypothetical protein
MNVKAVEDVRFMVEAAEGKLRGLVAVEKLICWVGEVFFFFIV